MSRAPWVRALCVGVLALASLTLDRCIDDGSREECTTRTRCLQWVVRRGVPTSCSVADRCGFGECCRLRAEGRRGRLVLQVHDELIVECPEDEAEAIKTLLVEEMEAVADLSVPLTAEAGVGRSWAEAH